MNAIKSYLSKIGKVGGKSKSEAKKKAARENGRMANFRRSHSGNSRSKTKNGS